MRGCSGGNAELFSVRYSLARLAKTPTWPALFEPVAYGSIDTGFIAICR